MLKLFRPLQRRGWSAFRMLIAAAYVGRFGEYSSVEVLRHLGVERLPDPKDLPWFMLYPIMFVSLIVADVALRSLHSLQFKKLLRRNDLPKVFYPLEMMWPKTVRENVWHPAYYDEEALYNDQPPGASRLIQNIMFLGRVVLLVIETTRVMGVSWCLPRLVNRR